MFFDIRTAALDELTEQRLRVAASLLGAEGASARIGAWDDTHCHLLVAGTDEAYGRHALALAAVRGIRVLALGTHCDALPVVAVSPLKTAPVLARELHRGLHGLVPDASQAPAADGTPTLCRLATPPLPGTPLVLRCHGYAVHLCPGSGRVYAAGRPDLLAIGDRLGGSACTIEPMPPGVPPQAPDSGSLVAFLLRGAFRAGERLPAFPEGCYHLDALPNPGTLPAALPAAQRIARALAARPLDTRQREAAGLHDIDPVDFGASLWAFAAAGLLRGTGGAAQDARDTAVRPPPRPAATALWSALTRRAALLRG